MERQGPFDRPCAMSPPDDAPIQYTAVTFIVDASNPNEWILPVQNVIFQHSGSNPSTTSTIESTAIGIVHESPRFGPLFIDAQLIERDTGSISHASALPEEVNAPPNARDTTEKHWKSHLSNQDDTDEPVNYEPFPMSFRAGEAGQITWNDWTDVFGLGHDATPRTAEESRSARRHTTMDPSCDPLPIALSPAGASRAPTSHSTGRSSQHKDENSIASTTATSTELHSPSPQQPESHQERRIAHTHISETFRQVSETSTMDSSLQCLASVSALGAEYLDTIGRSVSTGAEMTPNSGSGALRMLKPLTAYNYFYRVERCNIVNGMKRAKDPIPDPVADFSREKHQALLQQRWHVDPLKEKRQHRKAHGVISFIALSQVISNRWKRLSKVGRDFYQQVAKADLDQYEVYLAKQARCQTTETTIYKTDDANLG